VITSDDGIRVFAGLHHVTCGFLVQKAVDNCREVRISGFVLWTSCGQRRNLK
jgi:hypothetical protein